MNENRVRPPEFFGQIEPQDFLHQEGLFVSIAEFDRLPAQLLENETQLAEIAKQGKKFVIKEYITQKQKNLRFKGPKDYDRRWSVEELTGKESVPNKHGGFPFRAEVKPNRTLPDSARVLKDRENAIRQYFLDMPEFVLPSYIFIASPDKGGEEKVIEDFTIYEIQEKLEDYLPLHEALNIFVNNEYRDNFFANQKNKLENLKQDLVLLKNNLARLLADSRHEVFGIFLPDLRAGNIVIKQDGHLCTFDTNYFASGFDRPETEQRIKLTIDVVDKILNLLN